MPKVKREPTEIRGAPAGGELAIRGTAQIRAAEAPGQDGQTKPRTFEMVLYTGDAIDQGMMGWGYPVVCDLEGFDLGNGVFPILDNHGPGWNSDTPVREFLVGQSKTARIEGGELRLSGGFFEDRKAAQDIIKLADDGFQWQTSMGAKALKTEFVGDGLTVNVNGREWEGPVNIVRKTKLREGSFVVIGADAGTSALVAGSRRLPVPKTKPSKVRAGEDTTKKPTDTQADDDTTKPDETEATDADFATWCKTEGYGDTDNMTQRMKAKLRAEYDEQDDEDDDEEDDDKKPTPATEARAKGNWRGIQAQRQEGMRISGIQAQCAAHPGLKVEVNGRQVDLATHAIEAGWTVKQTKREVIRATRPSPGPFWYSPSEPALNTAVIEAAILQASKCPLGNDSYYFNRGPEGRMERRVGEDLQRDIQREMKARYTDEVQQAAHTRFAKHGGIGLHQVLTLAARAQGYHGSEIITAGNLEDVLRFAFLRDIRAEGGSTISIQNLLANVLNKALLTGYTNTNMSWREIVSIRPVKDFKPSKSINVTGDFLFKKLNGDGQIANAALTDEAFANVIDTYARKLGLPRQMIINDDISGLTTIPKLFGIGWNDSISILVWTLFMNPGNWTDSQAFWYASRAIATSNQGGGAIQANALAAGASGALSVNALQLAITLFDMQTKANGQPLGVEPAILLYPPALDATATELLKSQYLIYGGGTAAKQPNTNVMQGRFRPVKSPYLQNPNIASYSATAWWLLSDPQLTGLSTIECAFLGGQETPTVQTAQANFNELGVDIRGFGDFGVAMQNPRASVKSPGA